MPAIIIPFIPFGIWELRLPVAWSLNYLVERFNGIDEGSLTPGRGYGSRGYVSQGEKSSESTCRTVKFEVVLLLSAHYLLEFGKTTVHLSKCLSSEDNFGRLYYT